MVQTSTPDARFKRAIERLTKETFWLKTYQSALDGMAGVTSIGLDFFQVSKTAIEDARLIRLIRVLENDPKTASFWYLHRSNAPVIERAAKVASLDLTELKQVATRLRGIRDKAFVHIDKVGVFDPKHFYQVAGLTEAEICRSIEGLWLTMQKVYADTFGEELRHDVYVGNDIAKLASLRDASA